MTRKMKWSLILILLALAFGSSVSLSKAETSKYYYSQLDELQREIYDFVLTLPHKTATYNFMPSVDLSQYGEEELSKRIQDALHACDYDNPLETRWLWYMSYDSADLESQTITLNFAMSEFYDENDDEKIEEILNAIVDNADMSWDDYTKVSYISSTIDSCMTYDCDYVFYTNTSKPDVDKQHITGLLNGLAVCEGYTELYVALAERLGLTCVEVASNGHAFVHIKMEDGKWYGLEPNQETVHLYGDSMYSGVQYDSGWQNIYELNEDDFHYITMPHRTEDDYVYSSIEPVFDLVDVDAIRKEQLGLFSLFSYEVNEGTLTCRITAYSGCQSGDLIIPDEIDGYQVTIIGNSAFSNCKYFEGKIILPDSIELIESNAFAHCSGLTGTLQLPNSLKTIKDGAFIGCSNLDGSIVFNTGLERIEDNAFAHCSSLTGDLWIPDTVTYVGKNAFYSCTSLNGIVHIPDDIDQWYAGSIDWCVGLSAFDVSDNHPKYVLYDGMLFTRDMKTVIQCLISHSGDVVIPEGVLAVGDLAFYQCRNITSISFPSTLTSIGQWGAAYLLGLKPHHDLRLPQSVIDIGDHAFYASRFGGTIYYPSTDNVGAHAFGHVRSPYRLVIPEGVTSIPDYCFEYTIFKEIYLPSSITSLSTDVFNYFADICVTIYGESGSFAESYVQSINQIYPEACRFMPTNDYYQEEIRYLIEVEETHYPQSIQLTVMNRVTGERVLLSDWLSNDEGIATVDNNGVVTAVHYGQTTIEGRADNGEIFTWTIVCCKYPTETVMWAKGHTVSDELGPNDYSTLTLGDSTYVELYHPDGFWLIAPELDDWADYISSSNEKVIKVIGNQLYTVGVGSSLITISNNKGISVSATFTVKNKPRSISLLDDEIKIHSSNESSLSDDDAQYEVILSYYPEDSYSQIDRIEFEDSSIAYSYSNYIDGFYRWYIYGLNEGVTTATITTKSGISVEVPVRICKLLNLQTSCDTMIMRNGNLINKKPSLNLLYAFVFNEEYEVFYYSDSDKIQVDKNGNISAFEEGTANIWATIECENGNCYQSNSVQITAVDISEVSEFSLPTSLTVIEDEAFSTVSAEFVKIPSQTTDIGSLSFANCSHLKWIEIPKSVVFIANDAFLNVSELTILGYENSYAETFARDHNITFMTLSP